MEDRFNTTAGWALFAGIVALGLSSISHKYFEADSTHRPHKMGYAIEGVVSSEGGEAAVPIETLLAAGDPAKGEQAFKKCVSCHTIAPGGANGIGPNLHGIIGQPIAARPGFAYSGSLKEKGGNWNFGNMDPWLANPKKFAPGTKMTFAGLGKPEDRANLIVYLNAQGSNLPLPAAPTAVPAGDAAKAEAAASAPGGGTEADAAGASALTPAAAGAAAQPSPGAGQSPQQNKSTVGKSSVPTE